MARPLRSGKPMAPSGWIAGHRRKRKWPEYPPVFAVWYSAATAQCSRYKPPTPGPCELSLPSRDLDRGAQKEKEVARIPTRVRGLVFSGDGTVLAIQTADARTVRIVSIDSEGNANPGGEFTTEEPSWFVALDDSGNSIAMCGKRNGMVYSRDNSSAAMRIRSSTDIIGITYDAF